MKIRKGSSLKENRSKKSLKENRSKKGSASQKARRAKQGSKDQGSRDQINSPLSPGMSPDPKETASKREKRQPTTARGTTGSRKDVKKPKTPETAITNSKKETKSAKTKKATKPSAETAKKEADKPTVRFVSSIQLLFSGGNSSSCHAGREERRICPRLGGLCHACSSHSTRSSSGCPCCPSGLCRPERRRLAETARWRRRQGSGKERLSHGDDEQGREGAASRQVRLALRGNAEAAGDDHHGRRSCRRRPGRRGKASAINCLKDQIKQLINQVLLVSCFFFSSRFYLHRVILVLRPSSLSREFVALVVVRLLLVRCIA